MTKFEAIPRHSQGSDKTAATENFTKSVIDARYYPYQVDKMHPPRRMSDLQGLHVTQDKQYFALLESYGADEVEFWLHVARSRADRRGTGRSDWSMSAAAAAGAVDWGPVGHQTTAGRAVSEVIDSPFTKQCLPFLWVTVFFDNSSLSSANMVFSQSKHST